MTARPSSSSSSSDKKDSNMPIIRSANIRPFATADVSTSVLDGLDDILDGMRHVTSDVTAVWRTSSTDDRLPSDVDGLDVGQRPTEAVTFWRNDSTASTDVRPTSLDDRPFSIDIDLPSDGPTCADVIGRPYVAPSGRKRGQSARAPMGKTTAVRMAQNGTGHAVRPDVTPRVTASGRWNVRTSAVPSDRSAVQRRRLDVFGWHAMNVGRASTASTASWLLDGPASTGWQADVSTFDVGTVALGPLRTRFDRVDGRRGTKSDVGRPRRSQAKAKAKAKTRRETAKAIVSRPCSAPSADVLAEAVAMLARESIG